MYNDQRPHKSIFALAGWLFADMFLAIMMIFIVASTVGRYDPPVDQAETQTPQISGIDLYPQKISIMVNVFYLIHDDPTALKSVRDQVSSKLYENRARKAGIVLTFGCGPNDGQDTMISEHVNTALQKLSSQHFIFDKTVFRSFINRGCPLGQVDLEIYYFKPSSRQ